MTLALVQKSSSEEATGIRENPLGLGPLYIHGGIEISKEDAMFALMEGKAVEVANAGAGSYTGFFKLVGFEDVKVIDWTSSAGDWSFAVLDNEFWYPAWQANRYPMLGFTYSVDRQTYGGFETFERLVHVLCG
jgi:hypothetical protein